MTDTQIFIFGCVVFGIAITSTLVLALPPSEKDVRRHRERESDSDV